jgi:ribonuclease P protein component
MNETYLPTERAQARQDARLPQADVEQSRPCRDSGAPGEGTPAPVGVTVAPHETSARGASAGVGPVRSMRTFDELRRSSRRGRQGPVAVSFVEHSSWSRSQVAYAIGRRVGTAVVRNRLRRRMRAIMVEQASSRPIGAYVVRAGPECPQLSFDELKVVMSQAVERATRPKQQRVAASGPALPADLPAGGKR